MSTDVIQRHRPKDSSSSAIRQALANLAAERTALEQTIADETARRPALLMTGTDKQIAAAEAAAQSARLNIERVDVLVQDLHKRLVDAIAEEAGAARAQQVRDAAEKIQKFNDWLASEYRAHAEAIAAGVALERAAVQAIKGLTGPMGLTTSALPPLSRAFVNRDARGLGFLTRLPSPQPGPPIVWP